MNRLPDELQAKIDAEVEAVVRATVGSYYEPRIVRVRQELESKQQELETLESEYSQAIARYVGRQLGEAPRNGSLQTSTPEQGTSGRLWESSTARNGSRGIPSRRKMLLAVLPNVEDKDFIRREVESEILGKWPEVKPKTDAEHNNFTSGLAKALKDMVNRGQLTSTKGKTPFDPTVYRLTDKGKEMLKSGP